MTRRLLVTAVLLTGCTRPNPAFDEDFVASGSDEVDATEQGEGEGETATGEGETGDRDLPDSPLCQFQPRDGLDLKFGEISYFGGEECPPTADFWARIIPSGGGMAKVETCIDNGCQQCAGAQPLSMYPLLIEEYVTYNPAPCFKIQASVSLGAAPDICQWGAISIYDATTGVPYVIATAHSSEPTPLGLETLAGLIPDPVLAGTCDCEAVGQNSDCCLMATEPPEFWGYPWGDDVLVAGDYAEITLVDAGSGAHYFKVMQAQRTLACEAPNRSLSWAVVTVPP